MHHLLTYACSDPQPLPFSYYTPLRAQIMEAVLRHGPELAEEMRRFRNYDGFGFTPFCAGLLGQDNKLLPGPKVSFIIYSPARPYVDTLFEILRTAKELRIDRTLFTYEKAEPVPEPVWKDEMVWHRYGQSSIVVPEKQPGFKYPVCLTPENPRCAESLKQHLQAMWDQVSGIEFDLAEMKQIAPDPQAWYREQQVGLTISNDFRKRRFLYRHMPIYSWQADVTVRAPAPIQRFIWNVGLGSYLSDGFGGVMPTELIPFLRKHAQRSTPPGTWRSNKPRAAGPEGAAVEPEGTESKGLQNMGDYLS